MAANNLRAGTAYITVDGTTYDVAGEASYSVSTVKRETLIGLSGVQGFKETHIAGFIEVEFRDAGNLLVESLNGVTNASVTLELANGKTIVGRNMWTVESQEVNAAEGTGKVRFESQSVTEQTL